MMNWLYAIVTLIIFFGISLILIYFRESFRLSLMGVALLILLLGLVDFLLPFIRGLIGYELLIPILFLFIPLAYVAPLIGRKKRFAVKARERFISHTPENSATQGNFPPHSV